MGCLYKRKGSASWWIKYYRSGKPYRESARTEKQWEAKLLLQKREGKIAAGEFAGLSPLRTRVKDLVALYLADYEKHGRKTIKEARRYADLIGDAFGHMRAAEVTTSDLDAYRAKRKETAGDKKPTEDSTINRELSALRRMYRLGLKHDPPLVARAPYIGLVKENNVRKGFFTFEEFLALRGALPDHLKVAVTVGYFTGMRKGEILGLTWDRVDFAHNVLRLDHGTTKNEEGREVPITPDIEEVLKRWKKETAKRWPSCPWVCHYKGHPVTQTKRAWATACKRVGLEGRLFHDLRRSGVRNLVRAGVSQVVARTISGHKTSSVFDRYNIVSSQDLKEAGEKLSRYTQRQRVEILDAKNVDPAAVGHILGHSPKADASDEVRSH